MIEVLFIDGPVDRRREVREEPHPPTIIEVIEPELTRGPLFADPDERVLGWRSHRYRRGGQTPSGTHLYVYDATISD